MIKIGNLVTIDVGSPLWDQPTPYFKLLETDLDGEYLGLSKAYFPADPPMLYLGRPREPSKRKEGRRAYLRNSHLFLHEGKLWGVEFAEGICIEEMMKKANT